MKKPLIYILTILGSIGLISWAYSVGKEFRLREKKISTLPSVNLMSMDSSSLLNTGEILAGHRSLLIYFSPDCEHCQEETSTLLKHIADFKDAKICFVSSMPFGEIKDFMKKFRLDEYKNIVVAQDHEYKIYNHLGITTFPQIAIYDDEKRMVKMYKGEINISKIIDAIKN